MIRNPILLIAFMIGLFSCAGGNNTGQDADDEESQQRTQELPQVIVMTVHRGGFIRELQSNGRLTAASKADLRFCTAEIITSISARNERMRLISASNTDFLFLESFLYFCNVNFNFKTRKTQVFHKQFIKQ